MEAMPTVHSHAVAMHWWCFSVWTRTLSCAVEVCPTLCQWSQGRQQGQWCGIRAPIAVDWTILCSDVCLLLCFHVGHFWSKMSWMMQAINLTDMCGFQSHQMIVRCFSMENSLQLLLSQVDSHNMFFFPFVSSLNVLGDNGGPLNDKESQCNKAIDFINASLESLHKRFKRWTSPKLISTGHWLKSHWRTSLQES